MSMTKEQIEKKYNFWKENYEMNERQKRLFDINVNLQNEFEQFKETSENWKAILEIAQAQNIEMSLLLLPYKFDKLLKHLESSQQK